MVKLNQRISDNHQGLLASGKVGPLTDECDAVGVVDNTHRQPMLFLFDPDDNLAALPLYLDQAGIDIGTKVFDNASGALLGEVGELLFDHNLVSTSALANVEDFEALQERDLVWVSNGADRPPKHHSKKLTSWRFDNFIGRVVSFGFSGGRWEIVIDKTGQGILSVVYGLGKLTFCKVGVKETETA